MEGEKSRTTLKGLLWVLGVMVVVGGSYFGYMYYSGGFNSTADVITPSPTSKTAKVSSGTVDFDTGRINVLYLASAKDQDKSDVENADGLTKISENERTHVRTLKVKDTDTAQEVVDRIKAKHNSKVLFAEVDANLSPAYTPNDPQLGSQWQNAKIGAPAAWDTAKGQNVTVAIADSGVDPTHPDLVAHLVPGWNFYDNNSNTADVYGHGTAVAGDAAAVGDNTNQIAGVAFLASIMPLRVTDTSGTAYASTLSSAITYAADHSAKVVNMSFGGVNGSSTIQSACDYAFSKGTLCASAENNTGSDSGFANTPSMISTSATDSNDVIASFSTYGNDVDVAAPGVNNFMTTKGGGTGSSSGTSFSSPTTAGVIALIDSANPALTPDQVRSVLFNSALDLGTAGWDKYYGWGRVDAAKAVSMAAGTTPPPADTSAPTVPVNLTTTPAADGTSVVVAWNASSDNTGVTGYQIKRNGVVIGTSTTTNYTDKNVVVGATYSYSVAAYDAANNISADSNTVTVTVPTPALAIVSYSVSAKTSTTATITCVTNKNATISVKYGAGKGKTATLNLGPVASTTANTTSTVTLTGLTAGTQYKYQITVADGTSSVLSSISSFTTLRK